jgi:hypothetical protein
MFQAKKTVKLRVTTIKTKEGKAEVKVTKTGTGGKKITIKTPNVITKKEETGKFEVGPLKDEDWNPPSNYPYGSIKVTDEEEEKEFRDAELKFDCLYATEEGGFCTYLWPEPEFHDRPSEKFYNFLVGKAGHSDLHAVRFTPLQS